MIGVRKILINESIAKIWMKVNLDSFIIHADVKALKSLEITPKLFYSRSLKILLQLAQMIYIGKYNRSFI